VVFQFFQLLPTLTVLENVMLPMDFCSLYSPRERKQRGLHLLEQVEMAEHAHKLPTALSGGQQQRVAIARSLANDPAIVVADEPTGNLDSRTAGAVFHLFETQVKSGKTIVMVTHDDDLAKSVGRAVSIADGQIASDTRRAPAARAANLWREHGDPHQHAAHHPARHGREHHAEHHPLFSGERAFGAASAA
jgi:putative ABC transport system ATP-binding protein